MAGVYYNEFDPRAAAWLRELMRGGLIPEGDVDERSIIDVRGSDLAGYRQCHFFAGIGGWPYALRLAGWGGTPVWTGSCPCQPFSQAGQGKGEQDDRHLWPDFRRLIEECRPSVVIGEQVSSKAGRRWLDGVRTDLEALAYEVGAADLCAAGCGAPHIRQRLFWVADSEFRSTERHRFEMAGQEGKSQTPTQERERVRVDARDGGSVGRPGNTDDARPPSRSPGSTGGLVESKGIGWRGRQDDGHSRGRELTPGPAGEIGAWSRFDILHCTDGKARRVESGTFPLVAGVPARMGRLRGYGNAIVPQVAEVFIRAFTEARGVE